MNDDTPTREGDNRTAGEISKACERLLEDLYRLSKDYPDYRGLLDRVDGQDEVYQLRYHEPAETRCNLPLGMSDTKEVIEYARCQQRKAERDLESIANRISKQLTKSGIVLPRSKTLGASILAWAAADELSMQPVILGFGVKHDGNPFTLIRNRLAESLDQHEGQQRKAGKSTGRGGQKSTFTVEARVSMLYLSSPETMAGKSKTVAEAISTEASPVTDSAVRRTNAWKKNREIQKQSRKNRKCEL